MDVVNAWEDFLEQHIQFLKSVEGSVANRNLSGNTLVHVPFLEETLKRAEQRSNEIVSAKEEELKRIFRTLEDIISLEVFSSQNYDRQMQRAEKERKDMLDKVQELDYQLVKENRRSEDSESYVNQLFRQLLNSSRKDGVISAIYFNKEAYHNSEIYQLKQEKLKKWAKETKVDSAEGKEDLYDTASKEKNQQNPSWLKVEHNVLEDGQYSYEKITDKVHGLYGQIGNVGGESNFKITGNPLNSSSFGGAGSVSAVEAGWDTKVIDSNIKLATAEIEGRVSTSGLDIGGEAAVVKYEGKSEAFEVFGYEVNLGGSASLASIGGKAESKWKDGFKFKLSVAYGIGLGFSLDIKKK